MGCVLGVHVVATFDRWLAEAPIRFGAFDPLRPEPQQRNRARLSADYRADHARSPLVTQLYPRFRLDRLEQIRLRAPSRST